MALIRFFKPTLRRKDMDAVLQTMVDEKIGPGERRKDFLRLFCQYVNAKDGACLRSYIDALEIALSSFSLEKGSKLGVSVLSPAIYRVVAERLGLEIVMMDIDPLTGCISMDAVNKAMEDGVNTFLIHEPVCQLPHGLEGIKELGVNVIEDITESIGSSFKELKAGCIGSVIVCGLEEDGIISTGGGAIVVSPDNEKAEVIKGLARATSPYTELADMNAALGIIQLINLPDLIKRRSEIFRMYQQALMKTNNKLFGEKNIDFKSNGFVFPVVVNGRPDEIIEFAQKYNVSCKRSFTKSIGIRYADRIDLFPGAVDALSRGLSFPLYPFLQPKDIESIVKVIGHLPG